MRARQDHSSFSLSPGKCISFAILSAYLCVTERRAMRDGSHCDCAHAGFVARLSFHRALVHHRRSPSLLRRTVRRHNCTILHGERPRCGLRPEYVNVIGGVCAPHTPFFSFSSQVTYYRMRKSYYLSVLRRILNEGYLIIDCFFMC